MYSKTLTIEEHLVIISSLTVIRFICNAPSLTLTAKFFDSTV